MKAIDNFKKKQKMERIGKIIGKRKYQALKELDLDNLTEENILKLNMQFPGLTVAEAQKLVLEYEDNSPYEVNRSSVVDYFQKINETPVEKKIPLLTREILWDKFQKAFFENEKKHFEVKLKEVIENIKPLMYYFLGEFEDFKKCANLSKISNPSFKKGLLIIGGYGCGKTSVMRALEKALQNTTVRFKNYSANEVVTMFEGCETPGEKDYFHQTMKRGTICFDDVLTEREASNFGKHNLFKEIIEERYSNQKRTYITCNYKDGTDYDLTEGINQFGEKYGSRVYDRLFEMFNIIEFKGKSFRS